MLKLMALSGDAQAYQLAQAHTCAIGHLETARAADGAVVIRNVTQGLMVCQVPSGGRKQFWIDSN